MTREQVERLAQGELELRDGLGNRKSLRLNAKERADFEQARARGYVLYGSPFSPLVDIWWRWCEATSQPYVAVTPKRKRASVLFELTVPDVQLPPETLARLDTAIWVHARRGGYGMSERGGGHPNVPRERAELLARDILEIVNDGLRPNPQPRFPLAGLGAATALKGDTP